MSEISPIILCLLGTTRCGSTLLQSVLASDSGAIPLGEISRAQEMLERDARCICGAKLAACPFWAPALNDLRRVAPLAAWSKSSWLERMNSLRGGLAAMTGLRFLAAQAELESAQAMGDALARLSKSAGGSLFIDTSKDPSEFLRLTLLPSLSLVPVHLIRDPRAVAWSGFRRTGTDPVVIARHWARLNRAIAWLRPLTGAYSWQVVRYEDFCRDPRSVANRLLTAAGSRREFGHQKENHALGGSPGFSLAGSSAIVLDERWKAEMPEALQQRIIQMIDGTARKFGYT